MSTKTQYKCTECGATELKWVGQCNGCNAWNTLTEITIEKASKTQSLRTKDYTASPAKACYLHEIDTQQSPRLGTGIVEFDRVVGGGLTMGSVTLIGGDPGIGKSTLLLQVIATFSMLDDLKTLYISGEESAQQIALHSQRLGLAQENIRLLTEINLAKILSITSAEQSRIVVIDSIQTIYSDISQSAPGSITQLRESTAQLVRYAKQHNITVLLVGHVTKDGVLAGPRVLEHMVDTVLYFEGDTNSRYRIIRATKNRYGPVNELGVFAMTNRGLQEIKNPSAIFLSRHETQVSGSVIMVTKEGTRALLVEVQALVDATTQSSSPRKRISIGLEHNRLAMLLAISHRHAAVDLSTYDIFINIVGGIKITETAADLAIIFAVISSLKDMLSLQDTVVFGELGLAGEIRPVQNGQERLSEAAKHGFKKAIIPLANKPKEAINGLEVIAVSCLSDAIKEFYIANR